MRDCLLPICFEIMIVRVQFCKIGGDGVVVVNSWSIYSVFAVATLRNIFDKIHCGEFVFCFLFCFVLFCLFLFSFMHTPIS